MKNNTKRTIIFGVICVLFVAVASWYTITFNDARFIIPIDLSEYTFRAQDIPMIISGILLALYILYLFVLLARSIVASRQKESAAKVTRTVNPKLGFLGFLGLSDFWAFGLTTWIKLFSHLCFLCSLVFLDFSMKGKCQIPI